MECNVISGFWLKRENFYQKWLNRVFNVDSSGKYLIYCNVKNSCMLYFRLNRSGRLQKIMFSDKNRMDSFRGATPDEVVKFYDAYYEFSHMMSQSKNAVEHHLKPGQIVQFHNTRVLHARTAVIPKSDSPPRWLQGIYFEWDVIFSKLRVTRERLRLKTPHLYEQSDDFF